jgi:hypothetical protein
MNYRLMGARTAGLHNGDYLYETKEGSTPNVPLNYHDQQQNAICLWPNNVLHETTKYGFKTEENSAGGHY